MWFRKTRQQEVVGIVPNTWVTAVLLWVYGKHWPTINFWNFMDLTKPSRNSKQCFIHKVSVIHRKTKTLVTKAEQTKLTYIKRMHFTPFCHWSDAHRINSQCVVCNLFGIYNLMTLTTSVFFPLFIYVVAHNDIRAQGFVSFTFCRKDMASYGTVSPSCTCMWGSTAKSNTLVMFINK